MAIVSCRKTLYLKEIDRLNNRKTQILDKVRISTGPHVEIDEVLLAENYAALQISMKITLKLKLAKNVKTLFSLRVSYDILNAKLQSSRNLLGVS